MRNKLDLGCAKWLKLITMTVLLTIQNVGHVLPVLQITEHLSNEKEVKESKLFHWLLMYCLDGTIVLSISPCEGSHAKRNRKIFFDNPI